MASTAETLTSVLRTMADVTRTHSVSIRKVPSSVSVMRGLKGMVTVVRILMNVQTIQRFAKMASV